jgi:hypothetical protein
MATCSRDWLGSRGKKVRILEPRRGCASSSWPIATRPRRRIAKQER